MADLIDKQKASEPNLGNNGSICTKTGSNDEDRITDDCISRKQAIEALDKHIDTFDAIDTNYLCGLRTAMSILKEMPSAQPETHDKRTETHECDLIGRQEAIDIVRNRVKRFTTACVLAVTEIEKLPSAQPERDIPVKPIETTDKAWGIPKRQAVCPNCDYYLGHVAFLGDYKGKKIGRAHV